MVDDGTSSSIPANTGTDPNNADATASNEACDTERHFASEKPLHQGTSCAVPRIDGWGRAAA